jgi:hypothetical protein
MARIAFESDLIHATCKTENICHFQGTVRCDTRHVHHVRENDYSMRTTSATFKLEQNMFVTVRAKRENIRNMRITLSRKRLTDHQFHDKNTRNVYMSFPV